MRRMASSSTTRHRAPQAPEQLRGRLIGPRHVTRSGGLPMVGTRLEWQRAKRAPTGSRRWVSKCGRYMIAASELCYGVPLDPVWYTVFVRSTVYDIGRRFDSLDRVTIPKWSKKRRRTYRQEKWYTR